MKEIDARGGLAAELLRVDVCTLFYRFAQELPGEQILLNLGNEKLLICQDSDSAQRILRDNPDNFHKNFAAFTTYFGSSRLTTDGDLWRKLQKIGQPLLTQADTAEVVRETQVHYTHAVSRMLEVASVSPVVMIDRFIDHAAASVVMKTVFGMELSDVPQSFYFNLRTLLNFCGEASMKVYDPSLKMNTVETVELEKSFREVRETVGVLIAKAKKTGRGNSSLERFYSAYSSNVDLFGEFSTLLFAGFDTTSSTLCWALMLLANRPALQNQLRNELREYTSGSDISEDISSRSKTLMALINETFRMFPAIPILSRVAVMEDLVGAATVAPGQKVLLSIIGLHHDQNYWAVPSRMDIGRFPNGEPATELRKHFFPFSAGPRMCGGSKIAMTEISMAIAILLRDVQFEAIEKGPVRFSWGASMRHRDGIKLLATRVG